MQRNLQITGLRHGRDLSGFQNAAHASKIEIENRSRLALGFTLKIAFLAAKVRPKILSKTVLAISHQMLIAVW
jgi:hypothetical protein